MKSIEQLYIFLQRVISDKKLTATHLSVCTALAVAWTNKGFSNPFNISRSQLMAAAKIKSKTTYHKVISDLALLNYFKYNPSYHPGKGSQVQIL
jgi:hypothetical protein